jgi:ferredoxin, 2Fe-2S
MPQIKYVEHNGIEHQIDVPIGWSLMEGAVKNGIPGIDGDCGGSCACATCHVFLDAYWSTKVPPKAEMEATMLEFGMESAQSGRLSCQIKVTADLEGMTVEMPKTQR